MLMGMMIIVGFTVGFLVGCTGMGGIILIPALVYLSGLSSMWRWDYPVYVHFYDQPVQLAVYQARPCGLESDDPHLHRRVPVYVCGG